MINEIIEKIKAHWEMYPVQMVGAGLLVIAFACGLIRWIWPAWGCLVAAGLIDLYLLLIKAKTISRWVQKLTPKLADIIIMLTLVVVVWWLMGEAVALFFLFGLLNAHLFGVE